MGLFDFLKKKNTVLDASKPEQTKITDQHYTDATIKITHIKKEPISKTVENSEVQDETLSLSELIKSATPSKQGLYPHEIMMLEYAPHFKTKNNNFQNFWYYQYLVSEPQKILDSLFKRGFIEVGDLKSAIEKIKLPDIKEELKLINQKVSGKKDELIDRLIENGDIDYLNNKFNERYFRLTEKGEKELKDNQYVSYLHNHRYMSVWEMNERISKTHMPYRDILWGYFNEKSMEHFKNCEYGLYRCIRLNMHDFLCEEGKYKTAFHFLAEVISYDLSGLGNGDKFLSDNELFKETHYRSRLVNFFRNEDEVTVPPGIIRYFENLKYQLNLSEVEYIDYVYQEFSSIHIHDRVFNADECANIILSEIGLEKRKITQSYKEAEQRLKKRFGIK